MRNNNRGFTLVELMVAMAISLVVMGSIYSVYQSQQRSYIVQEQVAVMQQNLRAGMTMLTRDIRMAGYDPSRANGLGILVANSSDIEFQRRDDADTSTQTIKYKLDDQDGDGDNDFFRELDSGGYQLVGENIDALDFVYLDSTGAETSTLSDIRSIQVTMVAKTGRGDPEYVNNDSYYNQQDLVTPIYTAPGDNNRRRVLNREIKCRNLGL